MDISQIDQELKDIKNNYLLLFKQKDEQSVFYFIQMTELMYADLGYEFYDKDKLYDLVCNSFKNNIVLVFNNMRDYYLRIINNLVSEFCKIAKISICNKYINSNNLNNIYTNFRSEINNNTRLDEKINVLSTSNGSLLLEQLHTNCIINNSQNVTNIVQKYVKLISEEMIKNIASKNELILGTYKKFIENKQDDNAEDIEKIQKMNLNIITNTAYLYLKEQEYFVIEKYIKDNVTLVNSLFINIEKKLGKEFEVKGTNTDKFNNAKDYLLGFNNTLRVKTINIFDEMNVAVTLDKNQMRDKMKEFNDLISHIYEINIKFDKIFDDYKKRFSVNSRNREKFNKIVNKEYEDFTNQFKLNITNIFRENIKTYNDILYRSLVLKSRVIDFTEVLSESKVKDLLLK